MSRKTEIKVAHTAGFCWGVKRAMDMTLETAKDSGGVVYTHGPLIHNPQVIEMLEGKRVKAMADATSLESGSVIIRTHGVTPDIRRRLKEKGLRISDATCPLVAKVQGIIKKHARAGGHTLIIGDAGHAEVVGLLGYTEGRGTVIGSEEEVAALPQMEKVCVVAQTTCDVNKYDRIVKALLVRYPDAVVGDTICEATHERQEEVARLASEVELMVVVGGKMSANTARLAQLSREAGAETMLIETEEELDPDLVRQYQNIGLTAGASTPTWMIQRTLDRLRVITSGQPTLAGRIRDLFLVLVVSNASIAMGAAFMTLCAATLAGYTPGPLTAGFAAAYVFAMYGLNQLHDTMTFKHNEPERYRFTLRNRRLMTFSVGMAAAASFVLAALMGVWPFAVYTAAMALGLAYTVVWFPKTQWLKIHRLKDIPASKELFVGAGWAVVTAVIPALFAGSSAWSAPVIVAGLFVFSVAYIRTVVAGIRDMQGDRVMGRETIPILIGKERTKVFVGLMCMGLGGLLFTAAWAGWTTGFGFPLLLAVGYTVFYLTLYHLRVIQHGVAFDLTIDGVFHFSGMLAVGWLLLAA
ncbi:MAG: 4-hydroxy-3-methylbut-2-enyl diphosphate reductase [Nitrospinota bacterium]|nr:4-hydroxy-3-methylbut-2-enyl diphosphate reductase [Nitrospinota bacterium]